MTDSEWIMAMVGVRSMDAAKGSLRRSPCDREQLLMAAIAPMLEYLDKIGDQFADDCPLCTNQRDGEGNPIVAEPGDITVGDLRKLAAVMAVIS